MAESSYVRLYTANFTLRRSRRADCANEANSCHYADPEIGVPGRANVRNEANFPASPGGARPQGRGTRGKCAKRTQFGTSFKFGVSGVRLEKSMAESSYFKLYASNFTLRRSRRADGAKRSHCGKAKQPSQLLYWCQAIACSGMG